MHQQIVTATTKRYGLDVVKIELPQKGYRNESYRLTLASGYEVNLIFHKNEHEALARIKSANYASSLLNGIFPIRILFDKRTLKLSDGAKDAYAGLYTYLPGTTIPWEAYTKDHIKLLGWAMSDMHAVWRASDTSLPARINDELSLLSERMQHYLESTDVQRAVREKLKLSVKIDFKQFQRLFEILNEASSVDEHILHMDLVRGNVLFDVDRESPWRIDDLSISGIIDFEKAATGHPVFDITRTLAFLLVDCANKDRRSIFKYFLQSGYNKRGKNSFHQNKLIVGMPADRVLNILIGFFLLHDFYKFLRHTPYESLEKNHHFIRTRDILIDYGMIRLDKD